MNIGFLQFGAVGDIMFATPVLREVKRRWPDSKIEWLVRDVFVDLVETNPHVDRVIAYTLPTVHDNKQMNEGIMWGNMKKDAIWLKQTGYYQEVLMPQMWPDHNFYRSNRHLVDMMLENALGIDGVNFPPGERYMELHVTPNDKKIVDDKFGNLEWDKVITMNHVSYAASKVWSDDKYVALINALRAMGLIPMLTGASTDPLPCNDCLDARGIPYRAWKECIDRSSLWFGLDTGAKGFAAATATPMIVLQSPDFQVHKTGVGGNGLCKFTKTILEITTNITVETALDLITNFKR